MLWSGEKIRTAQDYRSMRNFDSVATKGLKPYEAPQLPLMFTEMPRRQQFRRPAISTSYDVTKTPQAKQIARLYATSKHKNMKSFMQQANATHIKNVSAGKVATKSMRVRKDDGVSRVLYKNYVDHDGPALVDAHEEIMHLSGGYAFKHNSTEQPAETLTVDCDNLVTFKNASGSTNPVD